MNELERFTVEQLQCWISDDPDDIYHVDGHDLAALARIALAVKQAQPTVADLRDANVDAVKAALSKGMERYSGAILNLQAEPELEVKKKPVLYCILDPDGRPCIVDTDEVFAKRTADEMNYGINSLEKKYKVVPLCLCQQHRRQNND